MPFGERAIVFNYRLSSLRSAFDQPSIILRSGNDEKRKQTAHSKSVSQSFEYGNPILIQRIHNLIEINPLCELCALCEKYV